MSRRITRSMGLAEPPPPPRQRDTADMWFEYFMKFIKTRDKKKAEMSLFKFVHAVFDVRDTTPVYDEALNKLKPMLATHYSDLATINNSLIIPYMDHGIPINVKDSKGLTQLMVAISKQQRYLIDILLDRAWATKSDLFSLKNEYGATALFYAIYKNDVTTINRLLNDFKMNVNDADVNGNTPLHVAVGRSHRRIVQLLIDHKCDVNATNKNGESILMFAITVKDGPLEVNEIMNDLLEQGANVMKVSKEGMTALWYAIANPVHTPRDRAEIFINYLAKKTPAALNQAVDGKNPVEYATDKYIKDLLRKHGAKVYDAKQRLSEPKPVRVASTTKSSRPSSVGTRVAKDMDDIRQNMEALKCKNKVNMYHDPLVPPKPTNATAEELKEWELAKRIVRMDDGYCYTINELINMLESGYNDNAHRWGASVFTEADFKKNHVLAQGPDGQYTSVRISVFAPDLQAAMDAYVDNRRNMRKLIPKLFKRPRNVELLYLIGKVGRICYFNQHSSHEAVDSGQFAASAVALTDLSEKIKVMQTAQPNDYEALTKLESFDKDAFNVSQCTQDAANGTSCIHVIGLRLIKMFVKIFTQVEKADTRVKYDPMKTGLIFENHKGEDGDMIIMRDMDTRAYPYPRPKDASRQTMNFQDHIKPITSLIPSSSSLLGYHNEKTKYFIENCGEDTITYMGDTEAYAKIPDWRKLMLTREHKANRCGDLLYILKCVTNDLNKMKSFEPYPLFPKHPASQRPMLHNDFLILKQAIQDNYLQVANPLDVFLNSPGLWEAPRDLKEWQEKCRSIFSDKSNLRFKLVAAVSGDDLRVSGMWVLNNQPRTHYELLVDTMMSSLRTLVDNYLGQTDITLSGISNNYYIKLKQLSKDMKMDGDNSIHDVDPI